MWGSKHLGFNVIGPQDLAGQDIDKIIIASVMSADAIYRSLIEEYGIPEEKIDRTAVDYIRRTRARFVYDFAESAKERGLDGSVAEGGVYRGDFSKIINEAFPNSTIYLFDTFSGFAQEDVWSDDRFSANLELTGHMHSHLGDTSVDIVLNKLPYPERAIIKKGYFPESAKGIDDSFLFVNLDFDLYTPIKSGLEFFYPKMVKGGVILVHDYYNKGYDAKKAVDEFCRVNCIQSIPIGDVLSTAIIKC